MSKNLDDHLYFQLGVLFQKIAVNEFARVIGCIFVYSNTSISINMLYAHL